MTKTNPNTATVVRVSGKGQAAPDRQGMNAQRAFNAQCVAAKGLRVLKEVEYADVSGDDVMYTPEMQDLQAFLHTPEMKDGNLVAKELSRLLRPNFSDYPLLQVFVDQRITIHLPGYELRLWTPEGRMLAGMMCAVDFNEAQRIRERCMSGREQARLRGFCAAGGETLATGFLWDAKSKTYSEDPVYLPNVLEAFRLVDEGETNYQAIINKLQFCLRPPKGRAPKLATPSCLRRLLSNRMYIGERVYDKKMDLSVPKEQLNFIGRDGVRHKRHRPMIARDEVMVIQVMKPVVSRERFDRVQAILQAKSDKVHQAHALHQHREKFSYRGLLFCADCGSPLYTIRNNSAAYYKCRDQFRRRRGTLKCTAPSLQKDRLEAELDRILSTEFTRADFLAKLMKEHDAAENRQAVSRRRAQLRARQDALVGKRDRIIDLAVEGRIPKADLDRRLKVVEDEMQSNRKALAELVEPLLPTQAEWKMLLRPFMRGFRGLPAEDKRRLVASRFQQIKVRDYRVSNLFLLTGEANVVPVPKVRPEENCHTCSHVLTDDDLGYNEECGVDVSYRFCRACLDRTPKMQAERPQRRPPVFQQVTSSSDTLHGL